MEEKVKTKKNNIQKETEGWNVKEIKGQQR